MVPTWTYAKSARRRVRQHVHRQHHHARRTSAGTDVEMVQETDYPWSGKIAITVNPESAEAFQPSALRVPNRDHQQTLHAARPQCNGIGLARRQRHGA